MLSIKGMKWGTILFMQNITKPKLTQPTPLFQNRQAALKPLSIVCAQAHPSSYQHDSYIMVQSLWFTKIAVRYT